MKRALGSNAREELGFSSSLSSVHASRTMMLGELSLLLQGVPADAPASRYRTAIVDENVLGKATRSTRLKTTKHMTTLYALDPACAVFRLLRFFWTSEVAGRPMLAFLAASCRDSLLRESTDYVLGVPLNQAVAAPEIAQALNERYPARFQPTTLQSTSRNLASSWTQGGYLTGKVAKQRSQPVVTPLVTAFALVLGYLTGLRGKLLMESPWARLLDRTSVELAELAMEGSKQGWLRWKEAGSVVEISFPGVLTPAEERLAHEPD